MRAYVFGANILENLTTGMYKDIMKVLQLTVHLIKLIVIKRKKLNYKRKEKEEIL